MDWYVRGFVEATKNYHLIQQFIMFPGQNNTHEEAIDML